METIGKLIIRALTNPTVYYTPWMPRQADNAVFTFEEIHQFGGASVEVQVFHKNSEDTGLGALVGTIGGSIGTVVGSTNSTFREQTLSGLKELVRYKIIVTSETEGGVVYRFHPPSWFNTPNA